MSFILTQQHLDSVLAHVYTGDFPGFLAQVEPEVEWRLGASDEPAKGGSGVYNVARFKEYVLPLMGRVFESPLKHTLKAAEVIGNKAIVEESVEAKMKNGQDYHNKHCMVMEFSPETGKIHKIRAYVDTEVKNAAARANGVNI